MRQILRRRPVSVGLAALTLTLSVATGSLLGPRPGVRAVVGTGLGAVAQRHDLLSLVTSMLFAGDLAELILVIATLLLVVGAIEPVMGSARLLLAYIVSGVLGIVAGLGLQAAGLLTRGVWSTPPIGAVVVDPFTPIAGALLAASAFTGPLWRRRIRVLGVSGLIVVLLYSGEPDDLYRLASGVIGLLLGMLLSRHLPRRQWPRSSHHEARSLIAAITAVTAAGPFIAIVAPHGYGVLRPLGILFRDTLPAAANLREACRAGLPAIDCARQIALARLNGPGAVALAPLPLLVVGVAALGMWRGRRTSAIVAIAVNGLLALLTAVYYGFLPAIVDPDQIVLPGHPAEPTLQTALAVAVPLVTAVVAGVNLRHFDVRSTRRASRGLVIVPALCLVLGAGLYLGIGVGMPRAFSPRVGVLDLLSDLPERYVPVGFLRLRRLDFVPITPASHFVYGWIGPLFWLSVLVATLVCSFSIAVAVNATDRERMLALLRQGGRGPISYMATWPGNRAWFSADGRNGIAYRETNGVALVIGEPAGARESAAQAARAFAVHCDDLGLTPAFYTVRPSFADALGVGRSWATLVIAEDTVLHPSTFSMTGKKWQDVRTSINRADRLGITAVWTDWQRCSLAQRAQIEGISEEWVADHGLPELGFTLGGLDELRDPNVALMLAVDADGRVVAVTSWLPSWRNDEVIGWTLDFMRRRLDSANGIMEFLIASVAVAAQQRGLEFVSLSAAPLAVADPDDEGGLLERLLATLARVLEPAYGFTSLAAFKAKFQPSLEPLVLAYPDALALPAISVALTRAYLPRLSLPQLLRAAGALR